MFSRCFPASYYGSQWGVGDLCDTGAPPPPISSQPHVWERITCICSASCYGDLCHVDRGTSLGELGRGLGTKENVLLGRAGSKGTGQEVGLGNRSLSWICKGWVFPQGDSKRHSASNFPLLFLELVQGLEECPWSVGPVLSVIHLSVPTSSDNPLLGPAMGRACLAYWPDFYALILS